MGGPCGALGEMKNAYEVWLESLKGTDYSEDLGIDGRIT
jgi:hypothetical protein